MRQGGGVESPELRLRRVMVAGSKGGVAAFIDLPDTVGRGSCPISETKYIKLKALD